MATMDRMGRIEAIWKMLWSNKGFGQRGVLLRKFFGGSVFAIVFLFLVALWASAEDLAGVVKKAVEKSTLDQSGTRPFHLKAAYAPSFERDQGLNRVGEIEIWWQSPTQWRREVRSPQFHQNGD